MVVASRCFAFRALITQAPNWKSFRVQNSTHLLYLRVSSSTETWKIFGNMLCQFFFRLSWHFKWEKPVSLESIFIAKQELITRTSFVYKTSWLVWISLLIIVLNKEFCVFSRKSFFYKSNRKLFSCICIAWYKHSSGWENSRQLCKPSTSSRVCITASNSPSPSRVHIRLCKHGKHFLLLK